MQKLTVVRLSALAALLATVAGPAAPAGAQDYEVASTEIQVDSRETQIPATVVAPVAEGDETFPLVVLHHGHGGGRNENGGLARVADALAQAGIISIRFDFAGAGDSQEPFTELSYTTMLADSDAALDYALANLPVDEERIGAFGYSEGSAVVAMQAGDPETPYQAVALMGPVAEPTQVFESFFGGQESFDVYYAEAQENGFAEVTTPFGQVQSTSLLWFDETLAADPTGDIASFTGPVLIIWGEADEHNPPANAHTLQNMIKNSRLVIVKEAGHYVHEEKPERVVQIIKNFLKEPSQDN